MHALNRDWYHGQPLSAVYVSLIAYTSSASSPSLRKRIVVTLYVYWNPSQGHIMRGNVNLVQERRRPTGSYHTGRQTSASMYREGKVTRA